MSDLLDALSYVGSVFDKPGRAVRGLLTGNAREGLAAVPFSDSLGLTDEAQRTSGRDLLRSFGADPGEGTWGDLAGMGAEVATDPLLYGGGLLGRLVGRNASSAAAARGPRYATSADDVARMAREAPEAINATPLMSDVTPRAGAGGIDGADNVVGQHLRNLLDGPAGGRVLSEIPEGSSIIGTGADAVAFRTPAGDALRIGRVVPGASGRPVAEGINPATRALDVPTGGAEAYRVERSPLAENVGDRAFWGRRSPETFTTPVDDLDATLKAQGLAYTDRHAGNVGMVGGRPMVIDPGAAQTLPGFAGAYQDVAAAAEPSRPMSALLDALGGDRATRGAIEAGLAGPNFARPLTGYGAFAGADLGLYGRTQTGSRR